MDTVSTIAKVICTSALITFVLYVIAMQVMAYEPEDKTVYLTEEEWANRPKIEQQIEHKHLESEPIEELIPTGASFLVYDGIPLDAELQIEAQKLCQEYKVGFAFFLAMCESESSFNTDASGDGSRSKGLMQINKPNWEKYGLDASMVRDNLEIGIRMMSELIEKYGEFDAVVMAYKGGEAKADEWIAEGFRLASCDTLAERTLYWQEVLDIRRTAAVSKNECGSNTY